MTRFDGKAAVITGGAKGIGESNREKILFRRSKGCDHRRQCGTEPGNWLRELDPDGGKAIGLGCNIVSRSEVKAAFAAITAKFGTVDILVNNAGITRDSIFHKMTEQQWDDVIAVNSKGLFNCTQEAWMIMREMRYGKNLQHFLDDRQRRGRAGQLFFYESGSDRLYPRVWREKAEDILSMSTVSGRA